MTARSSRITLLLAFITFVSSSCGAPPVEDRLSTLQKRIPAWMEASGVPGLAIGVLEEGELVWSGYYGVRSTETGEPVSASTVFEAASLSKPVFAAMVMQLVAAGKLDLEAPLWESFPYSRLEHDPRARRITGRMALTHTAGLPNWGGDPLEMSYAPGEGWGYSGEGYVYFSKSIEAQLGQSTDSLIQENVLGPLGMNSSSFTWRDDFEDVVANGHTELGVPLGFRKRDELNPAASLLTTLEDYATFVSALIRDESLAGGTLNRMRVPETRAAERGPEETHPYVWWSRGWGVQKGAREALWHWGDNGVFRCFVLFYPDAGDGVIYFTNSENGLTFTADMLKTLYPDDEHWSRRWLTYASVDDPSWRRGIAVRKAFLNSVDEGKSQLAEARADQEAEVDERFLDRLGHFLLRERQVQAAVDVFTENTVTSPDSPGAWGSLGEAQMEAPDLDGALLSFKKAVQLEPSDERLRQRLEWVRSLSAALSRPAKLTEEQMRWVTGDFGPRQVRLEKGELVYQREGNPVSYRLIPLDARQFVLDGLATFRLRFEGDSSAAARIVGEYFDGNTDTSDRTSP